MAAVNFVVTKYAPSRGVGAASIRSTQVRTSGKDTITTAENLEDASGDITLAAGEVLILHSDAAIRVAFGGTAATGTTGHFVPADQMVEFECHGDNAGNVSVIEAS